MTGFRKALRSIKNVGLLGLLMLMPAMARGQGWAIQGQVVSALGTPLPYAQVRVCPYTASGAPCSPLTSLWSDIPQTHSIPNPYTTDQTGNYSFVVATGQSYIVQIYAGGLILASYLYTAGSSGGGTGFPITLGATTIQASSTTTALTGLEVNGVTLVSGGSTSLFLNQSGTYTSPGGGGSGCVPSGTVGSFLGDSGSGGCVDLPADYNHTYPTTFNFPAAVVFNAVNPPPTPFLAFNNQYAANVQSDVTYTLPNDTGAAFSISSIFYQQGEFWGPFWNYSAGILSDGGWANANAQDTFLSLYNLGIDSFSQVNMSDYHTGDTQVNGITWTGANNTFIGNSDEGFEVHRDQYTEAPNWKNVILAACSSCQALPFTPGGITFQAFELTDNLVQENTGGGVTPAPFGTISSIGTTTINVGIGDMATLNTATTSLTVTSSIQGTLLQSVDVPRENFGTQQLLMTTAQKTFNVAMASNPNGMLCKIVDRQHEPIAFLSGGVYSGVHATLVSTGVYSITAQLAYSHIGGAPAAITLGSGGTGATSGDIGQTFYILQSGSSNVAVGTVTSVSGGAVTGVTITPAPAAGNYTVASGLATTAAPGSGFSVTGMTVNVTSLTGTYISCGGEIGQTVEETQYSQGVGSQFNTYVSEVYQSTAPHTIVFAKDGVQGHYLVNAAPGPITLANACPVYGVINQTNGQPDGGHLYCGPNNLTAVTGDGFTDAHSTAAAYTESFINDGIISNPYAQRNDIVVNRVGIGGGLTGANTIFEVNNYDSSGCINGGGGSPFSCPTAMQFIGGYALGTYYGTWPVKGSLIFDGETDLGALIMVHTMPSGQTSAALFDLPYGPWIYSQQTYGASLDFDDAGSDNFAINLSAIQLRSSTNTGVATLGVGGTFPFTYTCLGDTLDANSHSNCNQVLGLGGLVITSGGGDQTTGNIAFAPATNIYAPTDFISLQTGDTISLDTTAAGNHLASLIANSGTFSGLTPGDCVQAGTGGLLTTTGSACGSGGGGGVTSINSTAGAFTFTGSGVSCTTTTCTFSGGGGSSVGTAGQIQMVGSTSGSFAASAVTDNGSTVASIEPVSITTASNGGFTVTDTSSTSGFQTLATFLQPSAPTSNHVGFFLGTALSNFNSGYVTFLNAGTGSTSNALSFGLFGANDLLEINGLGNAILTGGFTAANLTDSALTSGNCVQASTGGLLTTTGSPCGSGGSGPTLQTNGTNNTSQSTLNFTNPSNFNGLTFTFSNPSGGVETFGVGGALTALGTVSTGTWQGTIIAPAFGGSGVANTATHTLGTSNQNWATLGTGIVKNTTTTGAISDAASSDVIGLWGGTCNSTVFLRGDGQCAAPSGGGTVTSVGFTGGLISVATPTSTPAFTVAGTSGGVPYFSSSSTWASSGALTANVLTKGGGAGASPSNSLLTDTGTTVTYTGTGGYVGPTFTANGTTAGFVDLPQGSTSSGVAPCNTANSICFQAPTSVTSQLRTFAAAPATGHSLWTNSSGTMTETLDSGITTATNCASSASPAVCGSASAGSVLIPTGTTSSTLTVNTTAVTANSQIMFYPDDSLGTRLSVTCNSTLSTLVGGSFISARTPGTSFTITFNGTILTNGVCGSFVVVN
jgi:hypothetical protein